MGAFEADIVIKPRPDEDFYVFYSTLHFQPMEWGTRGDYEDLEEVDEDFKRADKNGSSAQNDDTFYWDEWEIEIRGGWASAIAPESAVAATIDRDDLRELCESDVGSGFEVLPESVKWFYAKERVEAPKLKRWIPKKQPGEDSLWSGAIMSCISVPLLLISLGAFLDSPELTATSDWWGANTGSLVTMGFISIFVLFGVGGSVSTIRERRVRERARLGWIAARRKRPTASNDPIERQKRSPARKAAAMSENRKAREAAEPAAYDEDDLFGTGPRNWAGFGVFGGIVVGVSLIPIFSMIPMLTDRANFDGMAMFGYVTFLAVMACSASILAHVLVSDDGTFPTFTDARYSLVLFWYLVAAMAVCALLIALAPVMLLIDGYGLLDFFQALKYGLWRADAFALFLVSLIYWAGSATLLYFIVRGVWRRFARPIPFISYRELRRSQSAGR